MSAFQKLFFAIEIAQALTATKKNHLRPLLHTHETISLGTMKTDRTLTATRPPTGLSNWRLDTPTVVSKANMATLTFKRENSR